MENITDFIKSLDVDKTTEELEFLIQMFEAEISSTIGVPVNPTDYTYMKPNFEGSTIVLDQFPIIKDLELTIDDETISLTDAKIDFNAGIIYLKNRHDGFLEARYKYGLTGTEYETYIKPLVRDMILYEVDTGWDKNASSIKEGEVSVNFDTSVGKGALIQNRLNQLKAMFAVRVAMI